ncbi:hypothetical protein LSH36_1691g00028 [Paralvinella palmiformis]|uniref:Uncharacterized protein n=1 Tax=Paralvinella palmiformis TaxID=53620 RepID=A0AAD9IRJ0_9ANNE|nr:hypothetical protein LSH36_1691g00028 [Paralvinella palmiformis]
MLVWCKDVQCALREGFVVIPTSTSLNVTWNTAETYTIYIGVGFTCEASSYCVASSLRPGGGYLIKVVNDNDKSSNEDTYYTSKYLSITYLVCECVC